MKLVYLQSLRQMPSEGNKPRMDPSSGPDTYASNVKELERRRKNNEASRRSRAQKKDRVKMEMREVEYLKCENERLRNLLSELELVIQEANDTLIAKFKEQIPLPDHLDQLWQLSNPSNNSIGTAIEVILNAILNKQPMPGIVPFF